MKIIKVILILFFAISGLFAQNVNEKGTVLATTVDGCDTLPLVNFPAFSIHAERQFTSKREKQRYDRLKKNIMIAYPYAKLAGEKLDYYEDTLATLHNEKERKNLMKQVEKELEAEFGDELKDLTVSQGVILIKLIDRQTGNTSYQLVEDLRGKFSAFFWQGLARLFGHNLKDEYDAEGEEAWIEEIVSLIEAGQLPYYVRKKK